MYKIGDIIMYGKNPNPLMNGEERRYWFYRILDIYTCKHSGEICFKSEGLNGMGGLIYQDCPINGKPEIVNDIQLRNLPGEAVFVGMKFYRDDYHISRKELKDGIWKLWFAHKNVERDHPESLSFYSYKVVW